jgi:hypothetical protein
VIAVCSPPYSLSPSLGSNFAVGSLPYSLSSSLGSNSSCRVDKQCGELSMRGSSQLELLAGDEDCGGEGGGDENGGDEDGGGEDGGDEAAIP